MKKIAVEEHIGTPESMRLRYDTPLGKERPFPLSPEEIQRTKETSCDVETIRLPQMDEYGITMQILMSASLGFGYVEDAQDARRETSIFNNYVAEEVVRKHPDRFRAFAALPLQNPEYAAEELRRCVTSYGFIGGMVIGRTLTSAFLDDPSFDILWATAQELDALMYIHPGETPDEARYMYQGYKVLNGSTWSWGVDTATYVLRMIFSGVFDRYPNLKLMMGHMGEMLPFVQNRIDGRWKLSPMDSKNERKPSEYFKTNIFVSVSGNASCEALRCTIDALGAERVFFAVDYPFETNEEFASFIEEADLTPEERALICYRNAENLFHL